jgi:hypothetical protein
MTPFTKALSTAIAATTLGLLAGCGPSNDNIVYLRAKIDGGATCGDRLGFYRVGGDGSVTGPQDANGNFMIPSGQSLIVTDMHVGYNNPTTNAAQQGVSLYILGTSGEVGLWSMAVTAAPQSIGTYDRALTTGIRIASPWQICTAFSDQQHPPEIVVTGYLQ